MPEVKGLKVVMLLVQQQEWVRAAGARTSG